jgi:hypothetical protein
VRVSVQLINADSGFQLWSERYDRRMTDLFALQPVQAMAKAKSAANKALELDGRLAEAHATLAYRATHHDWDWAAAEVTPSDSRSGSPPLTLIRSYSRRIPIADSPARVNFPL